MLPEVGLSREVDTVNAAPIETTRLRLDPLHPEDTDDLFPLLDDPGLYTYIGGTPRTRAELEEWIRFVAPGRSPAGDEIWCNWVVRRRADDRIIGTAQATIVGDEASLAWVIGTDFQGEGYAKEAAIAVASWIRGQGVARLRAAIHPDHAASGAVARSIGLEPTEELDEGEVVWRSP
jgi:RimJ/RimL family protein N-acetyltransferase